MRRAVWAATLVLAGCVGGSDPAASRLEPGREVFVYAAAPATKVEVVDPEDGKPEPMGVGVRCRVLEDDAEGGAGRKVRVVALLLPLVREVPRANLRPAR